MGEDMYHILLKNKISQAGLRLLPASYHCSEDIKQAEAILVRSAPISEDVLPQTMLAVARCGAGVNNISIPVCTQRGIAVFNTPGANANAVKELTLAALFLSSRKIVDGIQWVNGLEKGDDLSARVEKGKGKFVGPELLGKTLGIIGLGAIGKEVARTAVALGMKVVAMDERIVSDTVTSVKGDWMQIVSTMQEVYQVSDYITAHVPLTPETKGMFCQANFACMKDGVRIINMSRGELVNEKDMIAALESQKVACYVTDFVSNGLLGVQGVIGIPHLGASTPEAEDNCAVMAVNQVVDYLENGNITNSVNFPAITMERCGKHRISIVSGHAFSVSSLPIVPKAMKVESKGEMIYALIDTDSDVTILEAFLRETFIKIRVL
ncbi:MAG TPA: 3-phosphoglycerate dehydrogenase [Clostridiales bacterium]|nr:3-phosphoglycerate dehydrogenase [Clostridiales bacterium]